MLRRDGQLVELHVYPGTGNEAGRYFIIGGITRYLAAPLAGLGELRVRQIQADTSNIAALIQISKQLNDSLEESDIDDAVFAKQLAEENHTQDEIAKMLGFKSRGSIHRLNAYFELPESIVELGKSNPSIFSAALAAILLTAFKDHGESFATDLLRKALLPAPDNLSHSELKHLIALESRRAARDKNAKTRKRLESKVEFKIRGITVGDLAIHKCPEGRKSVAFFAECDAGNADELAQRMKDLIREFSDRAN